MFNHVESLFLEQSLRPCSNLLDLRVDVVVVDAAGESGVIRLSGDDVFHL